MSNFPNMSYCQFENTMKDLQQVLSTLQNNTLEELLEKGSSYEREAIKSLPKLCKRVLKQYEEYGEQEIDRLFAEYD